jgi:hypothetical protein
LWRWKVSRRLRLERLAEFHRLGDLGFLSRRFATQLDLFNIGSIGVGMLSGVSERKRCDQPLRVDRVGESLKQLERAQPPAKQL